MKPPSPQNRKQTIFDRLVLLFEYETPQEYPCEFQLGWDLVSPVPPKILSNVKSSELKEPKMNIARFYPRIHQLQRIISQDFSFQCDGSVIFLPFNQTYSDLFQCVKALSFHFPEHEILRHFSWQQFEQVIRQACATYGLTIKRTFRFKTENRKFEVDCIGRYDNIFLFIDAKRWKSSNLSPGQLLNAAEHQLSRAKEIIASKELTRQMMQWLDGDRCQPKGKLNYLIPCILVSGYLSEPLHYKGVPILKFAQFNELLNNLRSLQLAISPLEFIY